MEPNTAVSQLHNVINANYLSIDKKSKEISTGSFFTKAGIEIKAFFKHGFSGSEKEKYVASQLLEKINGAANADQEKADQEKNLNSAASLLARYNKTSVLSMVSNGIESSKNPEKAKEILLRAFLKVEEKEASILDSQYRKNTIEVAKVFARLFPQFSKDSAFKPKQNESNENETPPFNKPTENDTNPKVGTNNPSSTINTPKTSVNNLSSHSGSETSKSTTPPAPNAPPPPAPNAPNAPPPPPPVFSVPPFSTLKTPSTANTSSNKGVPAEPKATINPLFAAVDARKAKLDAQAQKEQAKGNQSPTAPTNTTGAQQHSAPAQPTMQPLTARSAPEEFILGPDMKAQLTNPQKQTLPKEVLAKISINSPEIGCFKALADFYISTEMSLKPPYVKANFRKLFSVEQKMFMIEQLQESEQETWLADFAKGFTNLLKTSQEAKSPADRQRAQDQARQLYQYCNQNCTQCENPASVPTHITTNQVAAYKTMELALRTAFESFSNKETLRSSIGVAPR